MQTFMPCRKFLDSAKCLDYRRLGKQRVEAWQIIQACTNPKYGWQNHPAVKMWRGNELVLSLYGGIMCKEWIRRGYKDTMLLRFKDYFDKNHMNFKFECVMSEVGEKYWLPLKPKWLGNEILHASHRSNLLRKDPIWYNQFGWQETPNMKYYWPVHY